MLIRTGADKGYIVSDSGSYKGKRTMGKISPVSIKYNIVADIQLTGVADRPDVIGAVFGQTEGLLGSELELRELQKTGKIGRIEVNMKNSKGKSDGQIIIPSSMSKSETAIVAAAIETIDRVGPCDAKIVVKDIQDVRVSKRDFIMHRAEELLKNLVEVLPDSTEFTNAVSESVRSSDIMEYGRDKLPAGPMVDDSDEIIVVEGRADVLTMLKYGMKNVVALNGTASSGTLVDLMNRKTIILFVDGDRGGDLVIKKLANQADIDFVAKAPDGKEVEELALKEIQKCLRAKQKWSEYIKENKIESRPQRAETRSYSARSRQTRTSSTRSRTSSGTGSRYTRDSRYSRDRPERPQREDDFVEKHKATLKDLADDLIGTRGAYVLDDGLNILGKVPVKELAETLGDISETVFAIVMDGSVDSKLAETIDQRRVRYVITKGDKNSSVRAKLALFKEL